MKKSFSVALVLGMALRACSVWGVDLPEGYCSYGYLQASGGAYVDTKYAPNGATKLEITLSVKDQNGDYFIFGADERKLKSNMSLWWETCNTGKGGYVEAPGSNYIQPTSGGAGLKSTEYKNCRLNYDAGIFTLVNLDDDKTAVFDMSTAFNASGKDYRFTSSIYIFARHGSSSSTDGVSGAHALCRIRNFKIWEGDSLVRDYVPACRLSDCAGGLYDLQDDEFYPNEAASGKFIGGFDEGDVDGQHRLAYLESDGNQFVDTGYVFKSKSRPRVEARLMLTDGGDRDIMGTAVGQAGCFSVDFNDGSKMLYYRYGNTSGNSSISPSYANAFGSLQGEWNDCTFGDKVVFAKPDGSKQAAVGTVSTYNFSGNEQTLRLFKGRDTGVNPGFVRFAWVKVYDGDKLVRDYIPALVNGKVGLWDKQDGTLAENSGTAPLLCGPIVPAEPGDFSTLVIEGRPSTVGEVNPTYGKQPSIAGKDYECTAPTNCETDDVRAALLGWELYYDGEFSRGGGEDSVTVTAGDGVTLLRWLWSSEFKLTVTNSPGGTVTGEGGWQTGGATVELTAVPDEGHEFVGWTGDGVAESDAKNPTIVVTMDAAKSVKANFCSPNARRLAYIGSTSANQYINTKYVFTNKPAVVAHAMMTANNDTDFLGMPTAKDGCFIIDYADGNKKLYYRYSTSGYFAFGAGGIDYSQKGGAVQNRWIDFGWSNVVWHGSEKIYEVADSDWQGRFAQNTQEFHLFHARSFGKIRYSTVKMYDGDELVRDFIAAEIGGVAGLWDRVERKFYKNENGVAAFEMGEVAPVEDGDFAVTHKVTAGEGGTAGASDLETPLGETITLTATPASGYAFAGWVGNVPAAHSSSATATFVVTDPIDVQATFVSDVPYVVDPAGGGDFSSLDEAVAALAGKSGTVLVKGGVYAVANTLVISGGLTLAPESGRLGDVTIGAKDADKFTVVELAHPLARLSGLVISNGYTASSQKGGNVTMSAGAIEGCLITAGRMRGDAGLAPAAAGVYLTGGVLRDSVIRGNVTVGDNGGAVGVYAKGSGTLVENCDVSCNTNLMNYQLSYLVHSGGIKLDGGTVRNCFITNNVNLGHGNLYVTGGGRVEDTVVADNVGGFYFDTLSGGGFVPTGGSATFVRTTFARNSGYGVGGLYAGGLVVLQGVKANGNTAVVGGTDGNMDVRGCDTAGIDFTNPDEKPVTRVADVWMPDDTTDLCEAVRRCSDNGTVHVAAGEYLISGEVIVDRPVRIVGEGAEKTVFARDPSVWYTRLVNLRHAGAVLEGVTVRDGQRLAANCVNVFKGTVRQAVISDAQQECPCVIWNGGTVRDTRFIRIASTCNFSTHGTAANLAEAGALLEGCLFEGNEQQVNSSAGNLVRLEGGRISRCVFRDNRLMGGSSCCVGLSGPGVVESSLITHNDGSWYTGAGFNVYGSGWEVRNCTIVSNLSEYAGAAVYWTTNGNTVVRQGSFVNCIFYRNRCTKDKYPENFDIAAGNGTQNIDVTFRNCLFTTAEAAAAQGERAINPLSGDPKFRNLTKRDYRLATGSPCRNAGYVWEGADDPSVMDLAGRRLSQFGQIDVGCHASNRNGMTMIIR